MIHNDHLGTPQKMTDASGTVVWAADYKPFGEVNITTNTITNNLRFPGQYYDAETGLHYNRYRDYNPALDRYIEWDPIGLKGNDLNLYAYVRNPLRFIDPWGLELQVTVQEGTGTGTYGATVTVVNTDTNTTVFTGQGSSLPNNSNTQNTVATGTYSGTNTTRASGGSGIYIGETPTAPGSPRSTAYDIFVHCGSTQTNRGSAGCLTVRPDQCQEFFRNFTPEQPVTVNVRR